MRGFTQLAAGDRWQRAGVDQVIGRRAGGDAGSVVLEAQPRDHGTKEIVRRFAELGPPEGFPLKVTNLVDQLPNLRCPLLGLFGKEDSHPSPEQVAELDEILTANGKPHEFHSYDDAGDAFFAVNRPAYRVAASNDGWERIHAFFATHLGG